MKEVNFSHTDGPDKKVSPFEIHSAKDDSPLSKIKSFFKDHSPQWTVNKETYQSDDPEAPRLIPTLTQQVESLRRTPRPRRIFTERSSLMLDHEGRTRSIAFEEGEGMRDLKTYVKNALEVAQTSTHPDAQHVREYLSGFVDRFTFIGTPEYKTACHGFAKSWSEYVKQNSHNIINVVDGPPLSERKSYDQIADDIFDIIGKEADEKVQARIIRDPKKWQEGHHAKLVAVDDWIIGGDTADSLTRHARRITSEVDKQNLMENFELHVLVAAPDQLGHRNLLLDPRPNIQIEGTVKSYYKSAPLHPTAWNPTGTYVSGAHSSVDYGFNVAFNRIADFMKEHGLRPYSPLLTYIEPAYRPDPLLRDPEYIKQMTEYMSLRDSIEVLQNNDVNGPEAQFRLEAANTLRQQYEKRLGKQNY